MIVVERDIKKVLDVSSDEEVIEKMNKAGLTAKEREAVEIFYRFRKLQMLDKHVAKMKGVKESAIACRRMRALRKMGVASVVHVRGKARSGMFLGGNPAS